jgi:GH25 family lysozyme M1 (1,4-beta-N-acetylmuramidase)
MPGPLFVDTFSGAEQPTSIWTTLANAGAPWHGAIIKATQGTTFAPQWFQQHWPAVKAAGGDRYGDTWFRGAYHFVEFRKDGRAQADFFVKTVEKAGGFERADFWPFLDVELGGKANQDADGDASNGNQAWPKQRVVDVVTACAERVKALTGREVALYGNGAMRDLAITSRMGCSYLWCPRYTATLPREIYQRAGWTEDTLALWQYAGDGTGGDNVGLAGYPSSAPGLGEQCDISVLTLPGGLDGLKRALNGLFDAMLLPAAAVFTAGLLGKKLT